MRESVKVLQECIELQNKKGDDYQSSKSSVRQADYYPRGLETLYDIVWAKMLRVRSVLDKGESANFESIEDSFKDLINYASFAVAWCRGKIDGQTPRKTCIDDAFDESPTPRVEDCAFVSATTPSDKFKDLPYVLWRSDGEKFIRIQGTDKFIMAMCAESYIADAGTIIWWPYSTLASMPKNFHREKPC